VSAVFIGAGSETLFAPLFFLFSMLTYRIGIEIEIGGSLKVG
jgi:hypothetical protein